MLRSALLPVLLACACAGDPAGGGPPAADPGTDAGTDASGEVDTGSETDTGGESDAGSDAPRCGTCHGTPEDPAPPPSTRRATDPSASGVGAHRRHLDASDRHGQVRCKHCHLVPEAVDSPGHRDGDGRAEVTLSGLATAGVEASWDGERCTVFCHGGAMHDEARRSPAWTDQPPPACDRCHGQPPPAPHPAADDCGACHLDVADAAGGIAKPSAHVDGIVQAPHQAHLPHLGGAGGRRMECTECHQVNDVHGPLADGATLDDTTICAGCHGEVGPGADEWRAWVWPD